MFEILSLVETLLTKFNLLLPAAKKKMQVTRKELQLYILYKLL